MTRLPPAYFVRDGDGFRPTALTIGPWDPQLQHGGPASALLARALEHEAGDEVFIARVTVELLRPLPLSPMEISVRPLRIGRQVMWWDVDLAVASKHVARATGVGIRREALDVPAPRPNPPSMLPDECEVFEFPFFATDVAYHRSVEIRRIAGEWSKGPMKAWMRTRQPLIEGEVMSSLQRTLSIADASNGIAPCLGLGRHVFPNPDLTVYRHRESEGDWLSLDSRSVAEAHGVGWVGSELGDGQGLFGRSSQSLMVRLG